MVRAGLVALLLLSPGLARAQEICPEGPTVEAERRCFARWERKQRRAALRQRFAPPRPLGHRLTLGIHPHMGDVSGWLILPEARLSLPGGVWAHARLGPLALARSKGETIGVLDTAALIGWESRLFAFGLGVGGGYVRIEDEARRTEGMAATRMYHFRLGSLDGLSFSWTGGFVRVDGEAVPASARLRLRVPLREGRLLDVDLAPSNAMSWILLHFALEFDTPRPGWRIRPHFGIVEIIDQVRRDGGAGLSIGAGLVYRAERPEPP